MGQATSHPGSNRPPPSPPPHTLFGLWPVPLQNAVEEEDRRPPTPPPRLAPALRLPHAPPTFQSLPEVLHFVIANMLPNDERVSLSRCIRAFYGQLTDLHVCWSPTFRVEMLASLVRANKHLQKMVVGPATIPALTIILAQGCLGPIRELEVEIGECTVLRDVRTLAGAMRLPRALQALEHLCLAPASEWRSGRLPLLAQALGSGAAPSLRILEIQGDDLNDKDLKALAAMLKARANNPACRGLEALKSECCWWNHASEAVRCRLLRALLPSLTELDCFRWHAAYTKCFVDVRPLRLKKLHVQSSLLPSVAALATMSAVEELECSSQEWDDDYRLGSENLEPFIMALKDAATLPRLHTLRLTHLFALDLTGSLGLVGALAGASCASTLRILQLKHANLKPAALESLSVQLGQDAFPALQQLSLYYNDGIGNLGLASLAQGLQTASVMRLTDLDLEQVGMGDTGMAALGSVVKSGHFARLETLCLSMNGAVRDPGMRMLARAIEDGKDGLPVLWKFEADHMPKVTGGAVRAISSALIKNCPKLTWLDMRHRGDDPESQKAVGDMVLAAGCRHRLSFSVSGSEPVQKWQVEGEKEDEEDEEEDAQGGSSDDEDEEEDDDDEDEDSDTDVDNDQNDA